MNYTKIFRWGLYGSFAILIISAAVLLRPLIATTRFWLGAGFAVGIVGTFFSLSRLRALTQPPSSMRKNKFIHKMKTAKGFGSLEIIQRLPAKSRRRCDTIACQEKAVRATMDKDRIEMQEELVLLLLTDEQELIAGVSLYRGTSDEIGVDYRDIIQYAALARAYHIIVAHNHPDGKVQPSNADFDTASRLGHALRIAGFYLLDFVTVTRKRYYSMAENGLLRV